MENSTFNLNKSFFSIFDVINKAFSLVSHVANKKQVKLEAPLVEDKKEEAYYNTIFGD